MNYFNESKNILSFLIAEGSQIFSNWLEAEIHKIYGFCIIEKVNNVKEAKKVISSNHIDVAILDVRLNSGLGTDIISSIRNEQMNTLIIIFSNYTEFKFKCQRLGVDYFLDKTKDHQNLIKILKNLPKTIREKNNEKSPIPLM